jgi:hypothetical protein
MMPRRQREAQADMAKEHAMLKIVSGGQTGVDRAALDEAVALGIPYGGWCPRGGWAEDLPDPPGLLALYPALRETPERDPGQRTEWNVRDADALLVLTDAAGLAASAGTGFAVACAKRLGRKLLILDVGNDGAVTQAWDWIEARDDPFSLCIGGPRESEAPGIYAQARTFLHALLGGIGKR